MPRYNLNVNNKKYTVDAERGNSTSMGFEG